MSAIQPGLALSFCLFHDNPPIVVYALPDYFPTL